MNYIGIQKLGGLSHRGQILAPASRPWITDLSILCPYEGLQTGNIPEFESDPNWNNWCFMDSPKEPSDRLIWHVFKQEGKHYLVADRMLLARVSWQDLNDAGSVSYTHLTLPTILRV